MESPLDQLNGNGEPPVEEFDFEASVAALREAAFEFILVEMAGIVGRSAEAEMPVPSDIACFADLVRALEVLHGGAVPSLEQEG